MDATDHTDTPSRGGSVVGVSALHSLRARCGRCLRRFKESGYLFMATEAGLPTLLSNNAVQVGLSVRHQPASSGVCAVLLYCYLVCGSVVVWLYGCVVVWLLCVCVCVGGSLMGVCVAVALNFFQRGGLGAVCAGPGGAARPR